MFINELKMYQQMCCITIPLRASGRRYTTKDTSLTFKHNQSMNDDLINELSEADSEFVIITKSMADILNELDFKDNDEKLLCESIITNMEKAIATTIKNNDAAQIPFIGCVRRNPVKQIIRDNSQKLHFARKHMTKEEYQDYVREMVYEAKIKLRKDDARKLAVRRIKSNNKKKYDTLCITLGKAYAEMFVLAMYSFKYIPFDAEWQEQYDSIKD